jgi:hypothetical protein
MWYVFLIGLLSMLSLMMFMISDIKYDKYILMITLVLFLMLIHIFIGFAIQQAETDKDLAIKGLKHYVLDNTTGKPKLIWTNPEFNVEKVKGE